MKKSDLKICEKNFYLVSHDYEGGYCLIIDREALADEYAEYLPDADATGEDLEGFEGARVNVGVDSDGYWFVVDGGKYLTLTENPFTTEAAGLMCWEMRSFEEEEL